jgi:hypothetical protein
MHFARAESFVHKSLDKILGGNVGEFLCKVHDDHLLHAKQSQAFHFLCERLQQRRCGVGVQDLAGMRIKRNQRWRCVNQQRAFDDRFNDGLMTKM